MNTIAAISAILNLTNAALSLLTQAQQVSSLIAKAQAENRDITDAELASLAVADDAAKAALDAAIQKSGN